MTEKKNRSDIPIIVSARYGPLYVVDVEKFVGSSGRELDTEPVMSLCRCGGSEHKPICDGSHCKEQFVFVNEKDPDRHPDQNKEYLGDNIIVLFNRCVCSHSAECLDGLPAVFNLKQRPWIDANGASVKEIIETIEKCPSGALSYIIGSRRYQDLIRVPALHLRPNGPIETVGGIILKDVNRSLPECEEHYCLCRCGSSKNKPFCDGSHQDVDFIG